MEWPKFDFVKRSYSQRRQLPDTGKSNCGLKKGRRKTYRSFVTDFENIKSVEEEGSAGGKTVQNRNTVALHQHTCSKGESFQVDEKLNAEWIPPLSPVLVNGFLRNPLTYSLENSNSNEAEILTPAKCTSLLSPVSSVSILQCRSSITREFSKSIFTPPHSKKLLLSDLNPVFPLRRSEVISEGHAFSSLPGTSASSIIAPKKSGDPTECADICDLKCRGNNKVNHDTKLLPSLRTMTSKNIHSSASSLVFPETSPGTNRKHLNKNENSPNLSSSPLDYESDVSSSTVRDMRSCSDASQNHSICVDDSGSVFTAGEQSLDCFSDVTIHEVEAGDLDFESMRSTSSLPGNQLKTYDIQDENDEMTYQRPHHRLSKLAETLKKRMLIGSSDLAMWKCETPKQRPVRQVTVTSSAEQWGLCWTLVKNVNDSETIHVVDSEPIKRTVVQFSKRSLERNANDSQQGCTSLHSSQQTSSEGIFNLYQPLSKLSTYCGEFILAPRYYR